MPRKILIINSSADKNHLLLRALKELAARNFSFELWSSREPLKEGFKQNRWPTKKIFLGPDLKSNKNLPLFILLLPLTQLELFFSLAKLKIQRRLNLIIFLDFNEKVSATLLARLLGLKVVWLEGPEINYRQINRFLFWLYKINSRLAKIIVFNNFAKLQLNALGFKEAGVNLVSPGTKSAKYQENIFNELANGQANFHRKYFTVGAVTALNQKQKIEAIFQAVKISLSVIPNLQLIIIGEGEERKNLTWLAKKMEIENLVWLVGEQERLKKWLDSFDVFLVAGDSLKLDDCGNIIEAMAAELPVLAPRNVGLEDLVVENKTGALIEANNSEMLARQIIKLHQDKKLRLQLGKNGRERVNQLFTLENMAEKLVEVLKN